MWHWLATSFAIAAAALFLENLIGYPKWLQTKFGHPVQWIGALISRLDEELNSSEATRSSGALALLVLIACVGLPVLTLAIMLAYIPFGWLITTILATPFIAQSSMREHVTDVEQSLDISIIRARISVSKIVGRDSNALDENGIAKAALESLAENTSDGIVAPALWLAIAGLPGIAIYKAINTADSMIGHKTSRYIHFGWAAARTDDWVNLPASRLTGLLFATAARIKSMQQARDAVNAMRNDASKHSSPNAGWPEAAMAGALGLRLGGPRAYAGETVDLPWMGHGREQISRSDVTAGLNLFERSNLLLAAAFLGVAAILSI